MDTVEQRLRESQPSYLPVEKPGVLDKTSGSFEKLKGDFLGKDILSLSQFDQFSLIKLFKLAENMRDIARYARPSSILAGNIVTLLFYEPSSRTMGSFDAAVKQLGGQTIVVTDPKNYSSVAKGETFADTIKTFEVYSDAVVLRHPKIGAALKAAEAAKYVPIINAGDGAGEHPTQALLDLMTIWSTHHRLTGLKGLIAGDIKNGRTVHSLLQGLALYPDNKVFLLSSDKYQLGEEEIAKHRERGLDIQTIRDMEEIPPDCDFWYWTRIQRERGSQLSKFAYRHFWKHFLKDKDLYKVTQNVLNRYGGVNTILMHPLPRVGEIAEDVDADKRAVYLRSQIRNGMYIRMALLGLTLGKYPGSFDLNY